MNATLRAPISLGPVQETLLIPLYMRARESQRKDAIVRDDLAVRIVDQLDYDLAALGCTWIMQLAIAVRTEIFDQRVADFLKRHPEAFVVNLGAGLDSRFQRIDTQRSTWLHVDLPDAIELRRQMLATDPRERLWAGSALDEAWLSLLPQDRARPVLILAEGLFMYLAEGDLRALFSRLAERVPQAEVMFEAISPALVGRGREIPGLDKMQADYRWGILSGRELESWDRRIQWLGDDHFVDRHPRRWGLWTLTKHWPSTGRRLRSMLKVCRVRFRHAS
jgi:O-methyltransferase involved in polyketide biosynthesis